MSFEFADNADRKIGRRAFCRAAGLGIGGLILGRAFADGGATGEALGALPPPMITGNSTELCFNSRASQHSGLSGTATPQQMANILWAAGRAPFVGSHRHIRVATPDATYTYDPATHELTYYSSATTSNALRITYDRELDFDAGISYMPALLASVSLWDGTTSQMASCPIGTGLSFGIRSVSGLTTELVAVSSDGSLPNPMTDGGRDLEQALANIGLCKQFWMGADLTPAQLSQVLWGGYGCTPHSVYGGHAGLTVPSSWARYVLSERIYVVQDRVWRYHNRQGDDLTTCDHRLELVHDADVRPGLRQILPDMPEAPCYILLGLTAAGLADWYSRIETGFVAGGMLVQAASIGLACDLEAPLSPEQQTSLQQLTQTPAEDYAHAVVAVGRRLADIDGDGDTDIADFNALADCAGGPGVPVDPACAPADLDTDGDAGLRDIARFQTGIEG